MCHGSAHWNTKHLSGKHRSSSGSAANIGSTRPVYSGVHVVCSSGAKIRHQLSGCGFDNACGFGCYKRLMVYLCKNCCLYNLCVNKRCNHSDDRLMRIHNRSFWKGVEIALELEVFQIIEKCVCKRIQGTQICDIFRRKM